ncbi:MAG: alpha/beta hydrolase [Spirochaetes bacterium]|nr:alpha/beta hydrolase [Spirochaetota bacterium]
MKSHSVYKLREFVSVPFLILRILLTNFRGRKKYLIDKFLYGENKQQNIILVSPKKEAVKDTAIVYYHGGGWRSGGSDAFRFAGYFFADYGFHAIVPEYRKVPEHTFPVQIVDAAEALKAGIDILKKNKIYIKKIILAGQSAGAQLAALLAYSDIPEISSELKESIKGVISISGPLNFSECRNDYVNGFINDFVLNKENREKADPFRYLAGDVNIPVLCVHGEHDPSVELASSESFVKRINELKEGLGTYLTVKGGLHSNLVKLFWKKIEGYLSMVTWIRNQTR